MDGSCPMIFAEQRQTVAKVEQLMTGTRVPTTGTHVPMARTHVPMTRMDVPTTRTHVPGEFRRDGKNHYSEQVIQSLD
jgi:hypothetical protein